MKSAWTYTLAWGAVVLAAILLTFGVPRAHPALGRLPADIGQKIDQVPLARARDDERLIVIVTFSRDHRAAAESWIQGLQLDRQAYAWIRMPVIDDPGSPALRVQAEGRILARYPSPADRGNLLPLVTDRSLFVDATGVPDTRQAHVLVVNRRGEVLARVSGPYDVEKAATVLGTVTLQEL